MRLRLKAICYGCDFRKNELTLLDELRKNPKYKSVGELGANETCLFVSRTETQLVWLIGQKELLDGTHTRNVVDTRRWRLLDGAWNPAMLGNYAQAVGIELIGIRLFQEGFKREREAKRLVRLDPEHNEYEAHTHF